VATIDDDRPSEPTAEPEAGSTGRRALIKGAVGPVPAAAVCSAPRVEGLTVVPDYASAGTATTGIITFRINGNGPSLLGANNWMNAAPSPTYTVNSDGPSDNNTIIMTAPLGAAGNAVFTFPTNQDTDGPAVSANVTFNVDPPFNRCQILNATADWEGSTSDRGQSTAPFSNQVPNTTSPRSIPMSFPGGPGTAGNNFFNPATKLNFIEVRIQCT